MGTDTRSPTVLSCGIIGSVFFRYWFFSVLCGTCAESITRHARSVCVFIFLCRSFWGDLMTGVLKEASPPFFLFSKVVTFSTYEKL